MQARNFIPLFIRNRLRPLLYGNRQSAPSPIDVVKANTQEAFEYFFAQDEFLAEHYLEADRIALYEIVARRSIELIKASGGLKTVRVCDVGCGTGEMLDILRSSLPADSQFELFGLDFARSAILKAQKLLPTATLKVGDIYDNDLPTDYFDLVLCLETLEHLQTPEAAVRTLSRICRPGGHILITVPNGDKDSWEGHVNFWNVSQFAEFLSSAGPCETDLVQNETTIVTVLSKGEKAIYEPEAIDSSSD